MNHLPLSYDIMYPCLRVILTRKLQLFNYHRLSTFDVKQVQQHTINIIALNYTKSLLSLKASSSGTEYQLLLQATCSAHNTLEDQSQLVSRLLSEQNGAVALRPAELARPTRSTTAFRRHYWFVVVSLKCNHFRNSFRFSWTGMIETQPLPLRNVAVAHVP